MLCLGHSSRLLMLGLSACLGLAACGDDDASGSATAGNDAESSGTGSTPTGIVPGTSSDTSGGEVMTSAADSTGEGGSTTMAEGETTEGGVPTVSKSLMIAVDGLRGDALESANTPAFDSLIDGTWQPNYNGAYTAEAQCLTDANSVSGPNHWSIMTGATGSQHGVTGNGDVGAGDGENFPHYLSLLERDNAELNTAYLFTWTPDVFIPCEADYIFDGGDDDNAGRAAGILSGTYEDLEGTLETAWPMGTDVDAMFLFLDDVDGAGHGNGFAPDSPNYVSAIEEVDGQLGQILTAIQSRPSFSAESWQIVITTDHGGIGFNHGGMTPEELTIPFIVAGLDVEQGELPAAIEEGGTRNFDTVPTALQHMGVEIPAMLTGLPRG
ncbi:MAG: alkaline phosphatase family protein [Myxococcota bacterium]